MRKAFKNLCALFLALIMTVSIASASAFAAKVKLNKSSVTIVKGYSCNLKAENTSSTVKWSSSNSKVASVSNSGKVTARSAGTAEITAKAGNSTLKCRVKVVNASVSASKYAVSVDEGGSAVIKITAKGDKSIAVTSETKGVVSLKLGKWNKNTVKLKITGRSE